MKKHSKTHNFYHNRVKLCYNITMNKDVIYIEPEDDITSIIRKMNTSKNKLVALVPPKRIGVLRSAVNTRLIAKNAKQSGKTVVIVSTDSSLTKLSAAAGIPVADTLQSRPKLPDQILGAPAKEAIPSEITIEEDKTMTISEPSDEKSSEGEGKGEDEDKNAKAAEKAAAAVDEIEGKKGPRLAKSKAIDDEINSIELEEGAEKDDKKGDKKGKKKIPDLDRYKKWIIIGSVSGVLLIAFLVWAFVFAPFTKIHVAIRTTANNFSENVSFTQKAESEKAEEGTFYLEKQTYEATNSVDFTATGEKQVGEKATGSLNVTILGVTQDLPVSLPAGTAFTNKSTGLKYNLNKDVVYSTEGESGDHCRTEVDTEKGKATYVCDLSATLSITAEDIGEKYNLAAGNVNWEAPITIEFKITNNEISGGSSKTIKIVQQSDIDAAKEKLKSSSESADKEKLLAQFGKDIYKIDASYKRDAKDPTSSPKVGEEVKDGVTPKLTQTTTYSIFGVDTNKLNDFIKKKTNVSEDQKIYAVGTPFLENFREGDGGTYSARLKSTTQTGPSVTEEEILEKSKGRKIGEVQSLLKSINGVSSVKIDKSFFWVNSVPNDPNKVEIELKVEE